MSLRLPALRNLPRPVLAFLVIAIVPGLCMAVMPDPAMAAPASTTTMAAHAHGMAHAHACVVHECCRALAKESAKKFDAGSPTATTRALRAAQTPAAGHAAAPRPTGQWPPGMALPQIC